MFDHYNHASTFDHYTSPLQGLATLNTLLADGDKLLWSAAVSYYAQVSHTMAVCLGLLRRGHPPPPL